MRFALPGTPLSELQVRGEENGRNDQDEEDLEGEHARRQIPIVRHNIIQENNNDEGRLLLQNDT